MMSAAGASDLTPENWSIDYVLVYGGMYGEEEQLSEADIIGAIKEIEAGATVSETARKLGVSVNTIGRWRAKFGGMTVSEAQDRRRLEDENARLKKLVAQYALEVDSLKVALGKKW
jgi:putative transposase